MGLRPNLIRVSLSVLGILSLLPSLGGNAFKPISEAVLSSAHAGDDEDEDDRKSKRKDDEEKGRCYYSNESKKWTCAAARVAADADAIVKTAIQTTNGIATQVQSEKAMQRAGEAKSQSEYIKAGNDLSKQQVENLQYVKVATMGVATLQAAAGVAALIEKSSINTDADTKAEQAATNSDGLKAQYEKEARNLRRSANETSEAAGHALIAAGMSAVQVAAIEGQQNAMKGVIQGNERIIQSLQNAEANAPKIDSGARVDANRGEGSSASGSSGDKYIPGETDAASTYGKKTDEETGVTTPVDLGTPFNMNPLDNSVAGGPAPGPAIPGQGPSGGSGSTGGGYAVGGGSGGGGSSGDDSQSAPSASVQKNPTTYGSAEAATAGGGGGSGGRGAGSSGVDMGNVLSKLLNFGKEEKPNDPSKMLKFGDRALASADSDATLLDREVNIFHRVHQAYQEKQKRKLIGM